MVERFAVDRLALLAVDLVAALVADLVVDFAGDLVADFAVDLGADLLVVLVALVDFAAFFGADFAAEGVVDFAVDFAVELASAGVAAAFLLRPPREPRLRLLPAVVAAAVVLSSVSAAGATGGAVSAATVAAVGTDGVAAPPRFTMPTIATDPAGREPLEPERKRNAAGGRVTFTVGVPSSATGCEAVGRNWSARSAL